jgi:hypothetical protein
MAEFLSDFKLIEEKSRYKTITAARKPLIPIKSVVRLVNVIKNSGVLETLVVSRKMSATQRSPLKIGGIRAYKSFTKDFFCI